MTERDDGASVARVGLLESARRWGALAWSEQQLSALLAARVGEADDDATAVDLASQARRHGVRAGVVRDRLPELRELPVDRVVRPGSADWAAVVHGVATGPVRDALAGYARGILPALVEAYRAAAAAASPVAEPSARRRLGDLADELELDRRRWEALVGASAVAPVPPAPSVVLGEADGR